MAIKVYGDKIVFPDSTEQTTASTQLDGYDKAEMDAQQKEQDDKIQANTDAILVIEDGIDEKVSEAPVDGKPYARKNKGWHEVEGGTGDVEEAPDDGKTYGRKNEAWSEVTTDSYTKAEIDVQQEAQDDAIADNATNIATNTTDIAENATDIAKNKTDIETLSLDIDALTGSVIYKGSLNATVTPAPADAVVGDMYINEYNVSEPATNYPVASGWAPVTEVKYDDKLIKTDTGWDLIASVVGVPSYTAGEIDALLDDKADKADTYTKTETDTLLDDKANVGDSYTKAETYTKAESDTALDLKADKATTYTKTEVDTSQALQDTEIAKKANTGDSYTKAEAYNTNAELFDVILNFTSDNNSVVLFQNEPNPFLGITTVNFSLDKAENVSLNFVNMAGQDVKVFNIDAEAGLNTLAISSEELGKSGVYYYTLRTGKVTLTKKMVIIK